MTVNRTEVSHLKRENSVIVTVYCTLFHNLVRGIDGVVGDAVVAFTNTQDGLIALFSLMSISGENCSFIFQFLWSL
eukprot:c47447_g1_i1 orf=234-461(+)